MRNFKLFAEKILKDPELQLSKPDNEYIEFLCSVALESMLKSEELTYLTADDKENMRKEILNIISTE